ncbi:hypothetical protein DFJ63DRAFT_337518 [Scheffersomyces coipomensis]|uniref:uncharacterized protein n=1 Tax=Scheffersomyces coipomensis TaxID=1788519 RepID=UPI00315DBFAD
MAPPKKTIKMDLGSFLADDSLGGSWADEEVDLNSIGVNSTAAPIGGSSRDVSGSYNREERSSNFGGDRSFDDQRRERKEFPIPDQPPYRAKVSNLPWEVDEETVARHFESRMQLQDIVTDVVLPLDKETGKVRGFAFITFTERNYLEEALNLNLSDFNSRPMYVQVAAPQRAELDGNWRSSRSGPLDRSQRREEPDLDWGAARSSTATLPPRERSNRSERGDRPERTFDRPRREEPDLDWGSARTTTSTLPPRERPERGDRPERSERPPRKQEPDLDWDTARHSTVALPPRERSNRSERPERGERPERSERPPRKQEPELDWGSARTTTATLPPRERSNRSDRPERTVRTPKKEEQSFEWKRGEKLPPRTKSNRSSTNTTPKKQQQEEKKEEQAKPQKSAFSVLDVEGESDEEEEVEGKPAEESKETGLEEAAEKLAIDNEPKEEGWEVVGK